MAWKKLGLLNVKVPCPLVSICSVFIYTCPCVLPVSTAALLCRKFSSAGIFRDSCLNRETIKRTFCIQGYLCFQKPIYVRTLVCAGVELGLRRRHWKNAVFVYSALDIVYFSVVRKCFGRYLTMLLLFLRERNGARRRIDDRMEK